MPENLRFRTPREIIEDAKRPREEVERELCDRAMSAEQEALELREKVAELATMREATVVAIRVETLRKAAKLARECAQTGAAMIGRRTDGVQALEAFARRLEDDASRAEASVECDSTTEGGDDADGP